ncbi:MAG: glycosyltransferase [Deltaproteobacteria bacterium]|nr:glycosyltransferase [Deltaproteobacteria bacterium]MCL5277760.1 glycosyltransferase [Deltaproteobacteria bacterium]
MTARPLKVLFVHSSSEMYGSDRCLYELVRGIDKKRFVPIVVLPSGGALSGMLRDMGIAVYLTDPWVMRKGTFRSARLAPYMLKLPVSVLRLMRIIARESVSIVYSNTSVMIGPALAAYIMRRPHICHIRELYEGYPGLSRLYGPFLCASSKRIIAISNAAASLVDGRCRKKVEVVYDGIALDRFIDAPRRVPDIVSEWRRQGRIIVSDIGRISPIKGQELFIESARECMRHDRGLRFLIVGDVFKGNEQFLMRLRDTVRRYDLQDIVLFTGFVQDVDDFIASSDIIVLSTLIPEGLGQIVMEGMAAGRVVIAPDKGGPTELIRNGTDGILYMAGDRDSLTKAIMDTAADPVSRKAIGEQARHTAERRFGVQKNIAAVEKEIADAADQNGDRGAGSA